MPDEVLFQARSPLNYSVTLRRLTWERHEAKRPEIRDQLENVRLCIEEPHVVVDTNDGRHHYYRIGHGRGKTVLEEGNVLWFGKP